MLAQEEGEYSETVAGTRLVNLKKRLAICKKLQISKFESDPPPPPPAAPPAPRRGGGGGGGGEEERGRVRHCTAPAAASHSLGPVLQILSK